MTRGAAWMLTGLALAGLSSCAAIVVGLPWYMGGFGIFSGGVMFANGIIHLRESL